MDPISDMVPDLAADDPSFGPAMRKLSTLKRKFVLAIQILGPSSVRGHGTHKRAALLAGYGSEGKMGEQAAANAGWRLAHDPDVQAAILEESGKRLGAFGTQAVMNVMEIANTATKPALKLKANLEVLNRIGLPSMTEQRMTVTHELGPQAAMLAQIKMLLRTNPSYIEHVPPQIRAMLEAPKPVDVEFAVVPDPDAELLGE